jgi:hypothetical protein
MLKIHITGILIPFPRSQFTFAHTFKVIETFEALYVFIVLSFLGFGFGFGFGFGL